MKTLLTIIVILLTSGPALANWETDEANAGFQRDAQREQEWEAYQDDAASEEAQVNSQSYAAPEWTPEPQYTPLERLQDCAEAHDCGGVFSQ